MELSQLLPMCPALAVLPPDTLWDIRLRAGHPPCYTGEKGTVWDAAPLTPDDLLRAAQALCGHALALHERTLRQGFLPLPGGHRLGVCGIWADTSDGSRLRRISSLCLRLAHQHSGAAAGIWPQAQGKNLLLLGPPGSGKTTLLRDLARLYANSGAPVAIADERGEIAACDRGMPQLDVGASDVMSLMDKKTAITLLLRAMAPAVLITDELGSAEEGDCLRQARYGGVTVVCSAHARSVADFCRRPELMSLWRDGVFDAAAVLTVPGAAPVFIAREGEPCV